VTGVQTCALPISFGDMTAEEKENVISQFRGRKKVNKVTGEEVK